MKGNKVKNKRKYEFNLVFFLAHLPIAYASRFFKPFIVYILQSFIRLGIVIAFILVCVASQLVIEHLTKCSVYGGPHDLTPVWMIGLSNMNR